MRFLCVLLFLSLHSLVRPLREPISFSTAREKHERIRIFVVQKLMCIVDILPKRQVLPFRALSRPSSRASYLPAATSGTATPSPAVAAFSSVCWFIVVCRRGREDGGRAPLLAVRRVGLRPPPSVHPPPAPAQLGPTQCRRRPGSGARRRPSATTRSIAIDGGIAVVRGPPGVGAFAVMTRLGGGAAIVGRHC